MDNKRIIKIFIGIIVFFIAVVLLFLVFKKDVYYGDEIPDDYIAVFHGGAGEITYSTYIYKIDNGQANYGFEYINTTNTTKFWGSSEWKVKITDKGKFNWTDGTFTIAKKNNAYSYVKIPGDKKTYSIEEFQSMFIMN